MSLSDPEPLVLMNPLKTIFLPRRIRFQLFANIVALWDGNTINVRYDFALHYHPMHEDKDRILSEADTRASSRIVNENRRAENAAFSFVLLSELGTLRGVEFLSHSLRHSWPSLGLAIVF